MGGLPLELVRERGRTMLLLEGSGGEPFARLRGAPMEVGGFLRLAIGIAGPLGKAHQRGLVHKDLEPGHILVNCADGQVRLTSFDVASRLPRERQTLEPPETIAGTLASALWMEMRSIFTGLIINEAAAAPSDS